MMYETSVTVSKLMLFFIFLYLSPEIPSELDAEWKRAAVMTVAPSF